MRLLFCIAMLFVVAVANAAIAPAAALSAQANVPAPSATPVQAAPNEILGMLVCSRASPTTCGEMQGFSVQEYKFAEYVRLKTQNVNARIIGMQYDPRKDNIYLFFAIPEDK